MNERDKELADKCTEYWSDKGDTYFDRNKFADLIRADERAVILKLADSLGWVNVDDIRARGNT